MLNYIYSDFQKLKRQPLLLIHLLIPILGIIIFIAYYSYTPWPASSKAEAYLQVVALSFPLLISIVCSIVADTEASSGNFYNLLTAPFKIKPFVSLLIMLLLLGFGASLLTSVGFGLGFLYMLKQSTFGLGFYLIAACVLFLGNIFIYILHLIVSLRFGKGVSIGLGIVESLLSALLITGLGQGRWQFIPCGWGIWFVSLFAQIKSGAVSLIAIRELQLGILTCAIYTIAIAAFGYVWVSRWEGRKSEE